MKIGIFSPYFQTTVGGGERYVLTVAEFFLGRGDKVDIFWSNNQDAETIKKQFNLDLTGANFLPDIFFANTGKLSRYLTTLSYDLIFFLSDGSIPLSLAQKNILHFQTPFHYTNQQTLSNKLKLLRFTAVVCNSNFTKSFIDETYGIKSQILYPPVDVEKFSAGKKEKLIISVGHIYGHIRPKRQDVMIEAFLKISNKLPGWKLALLGSVHNSADEELEKLRKLADKGPVEIITDSPFSVVRDYCSRASIYWHAAGYGIDPQIEPEKAEHFGMSTVEAMAAGCVPIVFAAGGQLEIVTEAETGFVWKETQELQDKTLSITKNQSLRQKISQAAIIRSGDFSKQKFFAQLERIIHD